MDTYSPEQAQTAIAWLAWINFLVLAIPLVLFVVKLEWDDLKDQRTRWAPLLSSFHWPQKWHHHHA